MVSAVENEKLRELAVKLYNFKVIEGLQECEAVLPWQRPDKDGNPVPCEAVITIHHDSLTIIVMNGTYDSKKISVYDGPVKWLKGIVDYEVPLDERT